jgi:hypothetical protein
MAECRATSDDWAGSETRPSLATPARDALPRPARQSYAWLIRPQAKWVRLPLGFALIAGGALGFLPVLGIWMLPVGALLVGEDIPPVRRATLWVLGRLQRWWDVRRTAVLVKVNDATERDTDDHDSANR